MIVGLSVVRPVCFVPHLVRFGYNHSSNVPSEHSESRDLCDGVGAQYSEMGG